MEKSVKSYSSRERVIPVALLIIGLICASWLTIQSRDDGIATVDSIQPVILSDTTGKGNSSLHPIQKVADVNTVVEVEEVVEAKNDVLVDTNHEIPPVPPIPDIDIVVSQVPIRDLIDMNMDISVPSDVMPDVNLFLPPRFSVDTIPGDNNEEFIKESDERTEYKKRQMELYKAGAPKEIVIRGFGDALSPLKLYAAGKPLLEGTDYEFDPTSETVTIINSQILNSGRHIELRHEPFATPIAIIQYIETPRMTFSSPTYFDMDTIPGNFAGRDWEFRREFETRRARSGCTPK